MSRQTTIGIVLAVVVLTFLFMGYRSRDFHYCGSIGDRPQARVASGSEPCGPIEEPLDVRRLGWPGRAKLAGQTAAKAFGAK